MTSFTFYFFKDFFFLLCLSATDSQLHRVTPLSPGLPLKIRGQLSPHYLILRQSPRIPAARIIPRAIRRGGMEPGAFF